MEEEEVLEKMMSISKKSIAILYICTGDYSVFWKEFYENFEEYFCPSYHKTYFVFTDKLEIAYENNGNVRRIKIDDQPWPIITLLRFNIFLSIKDKLKDYDYLMFSNSNIRCRREVSPEELIPDIEKKEGLTVVQHPGYAWSNKIDYPYERRSESLAYIPWNCGKKYVIGALYIGNRNCFLEMAEELDRNVKEDLKNRVIALFHDESHLNRYIIGRSDIRVVGPSYCYPTNTDIPVEEIIGGEEKTKYFEVNKLKNTSKYTQRKCSVFKRLYRRVLSSTTFRRWLVLRDDILGRKIV